MISRISSRIPKRLSNYVGGGCVASEAAGSNDNKINKTSYYDVTSPATGKHLTTIPITPPHEIDQIIQMAQSSQQNEWCTMSPRDKSCILFKTAQILRDDIETIAELETIDTGRPISETSASIGGDIISAAECLEYMAGICSTSAHVGQHVLLEGSSSPNNNSSFGYTRREPLGVTVGIGSWNYPLLCAVWKSAPSLACGNSMIFKPSENTPLSAMKLAEAYTQAGLPDGIFNVVYGDGRTTGSALCSHPLVSKVSFTGSVPVGINVNQTAAATLKHVTLELGGKSPLIIFNDADLENAVAGSMLANWYACGEVCSNGTRVFVQRGIYDAFLERLLDRTSRLVVGNPLDPKTHIGAMISEDHLQKVLEYVRMGVEEGGSILNASDGGGQRVQVTDGECDGGTYIKPAIFVDLDDDMTIIKEEIFGPVMAILPFDTEEEAIRRANDTQFGLAAGVFTRDLNRAHRMVASLSAGATWINTYNVAPTELPWRGFKMSGLGQENGSACINYWTKEKSVYCEMGDIYDCGYPM